MRNLRHETLASHDDAASLRSSSWQSYLRACGLPTCLTIVSMRGGAGSAAAFVAPVVAISISVCAAADPGRRQSRRHSTSCVDPKSLVIREAAYSVPSSPIGRLQFQSWRKSPPTMTLVSRFRGDQQVIAAKKINTTSFRCRSQQSSRSTRAVAIRRCTRRRGFKMARRNWPRWPGGEKAALADHLRLAPGCRTGRARAGLGPREGWFAENNPSATSTGCRAGGRCRGAGPAHFPQEVLKTREP